MSDPLTFASPAIEEQFYHRINPLLRQIALEYAEEAFQRHGWIWHITSAIRTKEEDEELHGTGIHCTGRAIDVRTKDQPKRAVDDIVSKINEEWIYDPKRPTFLVAFDKPHGSGPHCHLQVHENTGRRQSNG